MTRDRIPASLGRYSFLSPSCLAFTLSLPSISRLTHFFCVRCSSPIRSPPHHCSTPRLHPDPHCPIPLSPSHRADAPPPHTAPLLSSLPPATAVQRGESSTHPPSLGSSSAAHACPVCLQFGPPHAQTVNVPTLRPCTAIPHANPSHVCKFIYQSIAKF